jgi:segregation and condensation protein B
VTEDHPPPVEEALLRLAEAMIFSSAAPVTPRMLARILPEGADAAAVITALRHRYAGRGVELAEVAGGVQFRTALDLAPALRKVIDVPRRLTRVAMETLAIVAYHQPVTRPEIEHMRGASLSQQTLEALLEARLIAPAGRKDAPGRPTLWATTPEFLAAFGLTDLKSLPRREDLFVEPPSPAGGGPVAMPANDTGSTQTDDAARTPAPPRDI